MKKTYLLLLVALVPVLPLIAAAQTTTAITLPSDFNAKIWEQAQALFTGFGSYIEMIVGVILGVTVLEIIVHAIRPK